MATWIQHLITSLISAVLGFVSKIIIDRIKTRSKFPKPNVYANLNKNEENKFFFMYYSKALNKDLLIIKLNVENLSLGEGKLYDVRLFMKRKKRFKFSTTPMPLTEVQKDDVLISFLKTDTFADYTFFNNEIFLSPKDRKQIYMIFDATEYLYFQDKNPFSILYKHSSRNAKIKKFNSIATHKCFTKHYLISEISKFKKLSRKK